MDGDFGVLEPLDEGDLCAIADGDIERILSHLNVGLRVVDDAFLDLLNDVVIKLAVHESVLARVLNRKFLSVKAVDFHLLSCHGSCLTDTHVRKETCLFDGAEVADEDIVVFAHLEDTVGERDLYGHRETLRHGDNEHDKTNDDAVNQFFGKLGTTNLVVDSDLQE